MPEQTQPTLTGLLNWAQWFELHIEIFPNGQTRVQRMENQIYEIYATGDSLRDALERAQFKFYNAK
jgi:hypothetical protein